MNTNEIKIHEEKDAMLLSLVDVTEKQGKDIENLAAMVDAIRATMMTSLRFELHDAMMDCITRGYATPDEYDRITEKMHNYTALQGNHGLQALYNDRFKILQIKDR